MKYYEITKFVPVTCFKALVRSQFSIYFWLKEFATFGKITKLLHHIELSWGRSLWIKCWQIRRITAELLDGLDLCFNCIRHLFLFESFLLHGSFKKNGGGGFRVESNNVLACDPAADSVKWCCFYSSSAHLQLSGTYIIVSLPILSIFVPTSSCFNCELRGLFFYSKSFFFFLIQTFFL